MDLARRSVASVFWSIAANATKVVVLFARSVILARLLPVEAFGTYAGASAVVGLTSVAASFGLGSAFLHRAPETADEEQAAAVLFTLLCIFMTAWAVLLGAGALVFADGQLCTALVTLVVTTYASYLTGVAKVILVRRVVHRRMALLQILDSLFTTLVAVGLAWRGAELWAILSVDIVGMILSIAILYVWRPVWRPRLAWSLPTMRYFIHFGSRQFVVNTLSFALDQVDDLWTGFFLGKLPLGFYARAYAFATYPRQVFAIPVNAVTAGTYAELKGDRSLLSKAFFRTSALLVYSGFFLGGLLTLVAPEMIRLLLGAKWLPMLDAFRLMLVFTLLDPLRGTIVNLFVAVGEPEQVGRVQIAQLGILIAGLFVLGLWLGITGVALAVDAMLAAGILLLLWRARAHVDFSLRRLFTMPGLALVSGLVLARSVIVLPGVLGSDWRTGLLKAVTFSTVYSITLLVTERHELQESVFPTVVHILRAFKGRMTLDT